MTLPIVSLALYRGANRDYYFHRRESGLPLHKNYNRGLHRYLMYKQNRLQELFVITRPVPPASYHGQTSMRLHDLNSCQIRQYYILSRKVEPEEVLHNLGLLRDFNFSIHAIIYFKDFSYTIHKPLSNPASSRIEEHIPIDGGPCRSKPANEGCLLLGLDRGLVQFF